MNDGPKTREEWRISVDEFFYSGLNQKEFCKQQTNSLQEPFSVQKSLLRNQLIRLQDEIKIELPNGFRCHVPCNI